jgi:hypothetical protein
MKTKIGDWVYICYDGHRYDIVQKCPNLPAHPNFRWYIWKVTSIWEGGKYIEVRRRAARGTWGCCSLAWSWVRCEDAPRLKALLNPVRKRGHAARSSAKTGSADRFKAEGRLVETGTMKNRTPVPEMQGKAQG